LAEKRVFLYVPSNNVQAKGFFKPITAPYLTLFIKPRNFTKRQCKLQWSTPPKGKGRHY